MTNVCTISNVDAPEEVIAAILIALQLIQRPSDQVSRASWRLANGVAPAWREFERTDLWRHQGREQGWRDR